MKCIVLGASGFIGTHVMRALEAAEIPAVGFSSQQLDLCDSASAERLATAIDANDVLLILSALNPRFGRNTSTFLKNVRMIETVCTALKRSPARHVVYFGSDAVYPFPDGVTTEQTPCVVADLYGGAHRVRELMLIDSIGAGSLSLVRASMVYGAGDPHDAYGPNRFVRTALSRNEIELFGDGEELRDHIAVSDVADLVRSIVAGDPVGVLNLAHGQSVAYSELARLVASLCGRDCRVIKVPRVQPVLHRRYDVAKRNTLFPNRSLLSLEAGVSTMLRRLGRDPVSDLVL